MADIALRPAVLADAEQIRAIYNHEVINTTATLDLVPRSVDEQRAWLQQRSGAFTTIVATHGEIDDGDEIVGFASLSPYKERAAYRTTVEDSIYVRRDRNGQGIGKQLLDHLLDAAAASGFHTVIARIESSGEASQALHAACGFQRVGVEREVGRKFNRWLDVVVMQCLLAQRTGAPSRSSGSASGR